MIQAAWRGGLAIVVCTLLALEAEAQTIGSSMVTFLQGRVGTRVGGGECAHMATEALRVSGGEFVASDLGADYPSGGDYVWGTLVTVISRSTKWSDSNPTNKALPGDVIQYRNATFTYSKTSVVKVTQHTSVIAAVNTSGRPTSIYQQNYNKVRTVQTATIDVTKLTAGWIRIYRPIARTDATNQWKVTVVNNASTSQGYTVMVGSSTVSSVSLTAANTATSFRVHKLTTTGTVPCLVLANGQSIYLTNPKGNELYNGTSAVLLGQLSP